MSLTGRKNRDIEAAMSRTLEALKPIFLTAILILPAIAVTALADTGPVAASATAMLYTADDGDGDLDHAGPAAVFGTPAVQPGFRAESFRRFSHSAAPRVRLARPASLRAPPGA